MSEQRIEELKAEARIGLEATKFLESQLGLTVIGMAQREIRAAVSEFVTIDPNDYPNVRRVQLQMAIGAKFEEWLVDLFNKGEEAIAELQQQTREKG